MRSIDEGLVDLGGKHPIESIQVKFDVGNKIPDTETLSTITTYLVNTTDKGTNLPAMVVASSVDDANWTFSVWFRGGTQGQKYEISGFITTDSGRKYWFGAKFRVLDLGLALPPASTFTATGTTNKQSGVTLLPTAFTPVSVGLALDYGTSDSFEVGILRAWLDVDPAIPVSHGSIVVAKSAGDTFSLTAPDDGVKVYWETGVTTQ